MTSRAIASTAIAPRVKNLKARMEQLSPIFLLVLLVSLIVSNRAMGSSPKSGAYCPKESSPVLSKEESNSWLQSPRGTGGDSAQIRAETESYKESPDHSAERTVGDSMKCECPLIDQIEYRDFKANLAPTIRQRLKELSRKTPTLESAVETAHSIGLLKLLRESNPKLDKIRDDLHRRAQELKKLFEEVDKHIDEKQPSPVL